MPIITISRGSYSWGKKVAEQTAARLGYDCVARDMLLQASKEFDVEEVKLIRAISDPPSFFDRLSYARERYIAYIRAALLTRLLKDNVVYHGLAGHFFVRDIAHALKIRIVADMDDRIELVMKRDNVSRKAAQRFINRIDRDRSRWSQRLYGIDVTDARLYDLLIHISKITVEDAVDIICHTARLERLQATDESRQAIADEALAAAVKAALVVDLPEVDVTAQDGTVHVTAKTADSQELRLTERIEEAARAVPGVQEVKVHIHWFTPLGT